MANLYALTLPLPGSSGEFLTVIDNLRATLRLLVVLVLALAGGASGALGATTFGAQEPTVSGSYLAGTQALYDMRTAEAAQRFRDALSVDWENPEVIERAFIAFAANGDIEDAAETAARLAPEAPQYDLGRLIAATIALREQRYDDVLSELEPISTDSFAGITGALVRAWALVGDGKAGEAEAVLDALADSGLEDFLVFHRALMAESSGDNNAAIGFAAQAYESDPFVARIVEAYARMLGNAGRFDEASAVLRKFADEGYTHPLVEVVAEAVAAKRRPGPFATSVQVGAAEMFHGIGVALARDGSADISLVFLRLGMYLDRSADVIALVLAQLYDRAGAHGAANAIYDAIPATSPMKPTAVVRVAENLDATGNRDEALRRLGNIVVANPDDLDALSVLGDLQRTAELYAEAADTYTKALALTGGDRPGDWRFYYVRGIAHERNKQWPRAEADFKRALELNPDQPQVLNYLGYSWVDQGMNLVPALDMIEKAVEAAPNDGYIVDSLGWAFYRLGRYEEAVEALERAVQLRPDDPEINDHLGDAYWRADRRLEARFQWTIAADVDEEDGAVQDRVVAKLANGLDDIPTAEETVPVETAEQPGEPAAEEPETAAVDPEDVETPPPAVEEEAAEAEPAEPAVQPEPEPEPQRTAIAPVEEVVPPAEQTVVVRPGDNLWDIATEAYGSGALYPLIVEANGDKLPHPALIHPGLELVLPPAP